MRALVLVALVAACYDDNLVPCGDNVCPRGKVCADDLTCVSQGQLDACDGKPDATPCDEPAGGVCRSNVCIAGGCGNRIVEAGELCDDGNRDAGDGCSADCSSREICGDGRVDFALGEECDCMSASGSCNSDEPGAACRTDCTSARCGDAIVDPFELCDDGNTVPGDGCRADCAGRFTRLQTPSGRSIEKVVVDATSVWVRVESGVVHRRQNGAWTTILGSTGSHDFVPLGDDLYMCNVTNGNVLLRKVGPGTTVPDRNLTVSNATRCTIFATGPTNIFVFTVDSGGFDTHVLHVGAAGTFQDVSSTIATRCSPAQTNVPAWLGAISDGTADGVYIYGRNGVCTISPTLTGAAMPNSPTILRTNMYAGELVRAATGELFAISAASEVIHWDKTTWTSLGPFNLIPGNTVAYAATGPNTMLAVGNSGLVLQLDGSTWTHLLTPTELDLTTISTFGGVVFVGGVGGTLMY